MSDRFLFWSAEFLGIPVVRCLLSTLKPVFLHREHERHLLEQQTSFIYTFWHSHILFFLNAYRNSGVQPLISSSKDGEIIARVIQRLGMFPIRGSSSRGGTQAMREMLDHLAQPNIHVAITPDGPRGPKETVQKGALFAAAKANVPIVPIGVRASREWRLASWDQFRIPKPFSTLVFVFGEPIYLAQEMDWEKKKNALQSAMENVNSEASAYLRRIAR